MNWITKMFSSSLGQKLIMAITGLFLISFLVVHCTLNSLIFLNDGGVTFNAGAEFMATNPIIRIVEVVLFIGLILHLF
jgi:succinate dehydrogenase / fumarate reductase cytochrome b subunit